MVKPPALSGRKVADALTKLGFVFVRQKGSHAVFKRLTGIHAVVCVVPMHKELALGTLRGVLKQAGISLEEFIEFIRTKG